MHCFCIHYTQELDYETQLPANETLQKLMNFLTDIVDDGERFDVGTLNIADGEDLSGANPSEDLDADIITIRTPMGQFDLFLNKLLQLQAVEFVKSLQHFVSKVTASVWRSRKDVAALNKLKAAASGSFSTDHLATLTMSSSIASRLSAAEELNLGELASIVWSYLDELLLQMKQSPLWMEESSVQFEQTSKHCERFLFKQLHSSLCAASSVAADDQRTHDRISSLQFLSAEHLDIRSFQYLLDDSADPPGSSSDPGASGAPGREAAVLAEAVQHLRELENARCPEDKLLCVRNCSVAIAQVKHFGLSCICIHTCILAYVHIHTCLHTQLLKTAHQRKSERQATLRPITTTSTPGADELLPVMILTIKCCNPRDIHSDIKYLQHFLRPARMVSEAGYLLTNLVSAVYFLDNVVQILILMPFHRSSVMY